MQNTNILQNIPIFFVHVKFFSYLCSRKGVANNFFAWQSHAWVSVQICEGGIADIVNSVY